MARGLWLAAASLLLASPLRAASSYVLPDGSRAPAVTLHCATGAGTAIACGTPAQPLVVSPSAGGATSANQSTEIGTQEDISQDIGAQTDAVYSNGPGSMISLLKGLNSELSNGVAAVPVGGQLSSRTITVTAGTNNVLFASNAARRYLGFQAPQGSSIWVNFMGGAATPNGVDCAYFPASAFYESGQFVNRGSITIYSPIAATISAWEG